MESGHRENLANLFSLQDSVYLSGKWEAWPRAVGFELGFNPGIKSYKEAQTQDVKRNPHQLEPAMDHTHLPAPTPAEQLLRTIPDC